MQSLHYILGEEITSLDTIGSLRMHARKHASHAPIPGRILTEVTTPVATAFAGDAIACSGQAFVGLPGRVQGLESVC